ncbi:MAG: COR domain-containing protein [Bacteroidia bacterium]|nr:COR domain-containing protein [Bacteroidia bacterium]
MTLEPIIRQLEKKSGLTNVSAAEPQVLFRQWSEKTYSLDDEGFVYSLNLAGMGLTDGDLASVWQMDLSRLVVLNLTENQLTSVRIPANLPRLKYLSLNENKELTYLSFENGLPALEKLETHLCQLEKFALPKGFDSLTWLDLSRNKTLAECTFEGDCPALESLDLSGNGLTAFSLPDGFDGLEYLYLSKNKISKLSFPPILSSLKTLDLVGNQLQDIHDDFPEFFPALESLYLAENPFQDTAIMGNVQNPSYGNFNSRAFIRNYLRQLKQGRTPENECKVLLVGNGNVGKSCLVHRLVDEKFEEEWNSTHAIVLKQYELEDWLLHLWDFGGQDIYHTTHRLFMQSNAVYLVLWDWKTENDDFTGREESGKIRNYKNHKLPYWLAYAKSQGQGSPAIVVQTKMGKDGKKDRPDIREAYQKQFPFFDFAYVESKEDNPDKNGYPELKQIIKKAIRQTRIRTDIPQTWADLRQNIRQLQAEKEKHITMEKFLELAAAVDEKEPVRVLLENWLVKTGVVFYRKGLFQDLIILDQERAIKAIYTLFDRNRFYYKVFEGNKGKFSGKELTSVWNEHNGAERELFVSFMLSCEMCFEKTIKKENQYSVPFEERNFIAPQLLPEEKPPTLEDIWEDRPSLFFRYKHDFLHYGIIQSFIVRTQTLAEERDIWKLGIFIKDEKEKAMIETRENEINVRVTLGGKKLLDKIRNLLEEIQGKTGSESVSVDGVNYVLLEKLKNHSPRNPEIECENGEWVEYKLFEPFLHKDEQAKFEIKTETTDKMNSIHDLPKDEPIKPTPVPQPTQTGPSKILFLAANPTDESHLQTDQEHRILKAEMGRGRGRDKYSFLPPQFAVTITELLRALNDKPQIVHFAGHGERKGIYITKDNNDAQLLPEEAAKRLFKTLKGHTEMVILNACYSASQAKTISEFGMYVVGNNIDVKDNAAISFTKGLYTGLGEGKSFEDAINDALIVVLTENASAASHIEVWKDGKKLDL